MSRTIRGPGDDHLRRISDLLAEYEARHPRAAIEMYRQNSASIRIRIIDPDFTGLDRAERHDRVWELIERLPHDVQDEITVLLLLTPDEVASSFANLDFDHPIPSTL